MKGKVALVVGMATGYVLGTRDGRGRYQQIKTQATRVLQDPRVQQKASQATDLAKDKAPMVMDKVAGVTKKATGKVTRSDDSSSRSGARTESTDSSDSTGRSDSTAGPGDTGDDDVIVVTAPSPSPLAPGPTGGTSPSAPAGGRDG